MLATAALASGLALACAGSTSSIDDAESAEQADASSEPRDAAALTDAGAFADSGASAASNTNPESCTPITTPKRVVRLTEHQLFNAYETLFGEAAAASIIEDEHRPSSGDREFPPISGELGVSEALFALSDRLAMSAMRHVSTNSATLTSCGEPPSDAACVQRYLSSFAERAFRHPLSADEEQALDGRFWAEMNDAGATLNQALGYGVYGILSSPNFLYRTEFGSDANVAGPLSPHELAAAIALFLTDRPPDRELLEAARDHRLATPDDVRDQVTRILSTKEARANLEQVLIDYLRFNAVPNVIVNAEAVPGLQVTKGLLTSIHREGELFLSNQLWTGALRDLLGSRRTWTNAQVATQIYGVPAPTEVDADGFGLIELPPDRAGLLTLSTFLAAGSRPNGSSPVARGLAVNASLVCEINPPFPVSIDAETGAATAGAAVSDAIAALADESELVKARYRAATPTCAGCHSQFDAFGMVLEPFDALGRARTTDLAGRPIDESWTTVELPESVGGATVTSAADAARALVVSGTFDRCMAMNFINYALGEVTRGGARGRDDCAVQQVLEAFQETDQSFASLLREVAASETLLVRSKGQSATTLDH